MDASNNPPVLFGVKPLRTDVPVAAPAASAAPPLGEGRHLAMLGALMGDLLLLPAGVRVDGLRVLERYLSKAQKEHFFGLEEAQSVEGVTAAIQQVYLSEALRVLRGPQPSVEAACAAVKAAFDRRSSAKAAVLEALTSQQRGAPQTRGPVQDAASSIKAALVVSLIELFASPVGNKAYDRWGQLVGVAVGALRSVLQSALGAAASGGIEAAQVAVSRTGAVSRPLIVSALGAHLRGLAPFDVPTLVGSIQAVEGILAGSASGRTVSQSSVAQSNQSPPVEPTGSPPRAQREAAPMASQPGARPRPQVGSFGDARGGVGQRGAAQDRAPAAAASRQYTSVDQGAAPPPAFMPAGGGSFGGFAG